MTAMTAMTLDALSGGRFRLGLGVSGPQVVEGWHGQPFGKPLVKTREYVEIVRAILRREKPVEFRGEYYQIPYAGPGATGLGKPLRSILHGRADLPIYLAAVGPKNVALAAEIADGWIPVFFSARRMPAVPRVAGRGLQGGRPIRRRSVPLRRHADDLGGGGRRRGGVPGRREAATRALRRRHGRARAELLQRHRAALRLRGGREAHPGRSTWPGARTKPAAAVPDALVDEIALCGPRERIRERLTEWKTSGVTTLMVTGDTTAVRTMAELVL